MPGVLVDDQSFSIDSVTRASLIDSLSGAVSCGSPPSYPFNNPFSYARSPLSKFAPHLSRSFSANNSRDREYSHVLSELSPRSYHRSPGFFNEPCTESLNILGNSHRDPGNPSVDPAFAPRAAQEFQLNTSMVDLVGNGDDFAANIEEGGFYGGYSDAIFPGSDSMTMAGNGSDIDEQVPGSPFSSGASMWSHSATGGSLVGSPTLSDAVLALHKFLPSNLEDEEALAAMDAYSCDEFRMFEFKVRRCMRGRSHDWTECPFAHPGEKARRRDPRRFHYSGTACPDFRKGNCKRGDGCEYAHGVFECWLHPARYRTQPCKDGQNCKRRVCFFAHTSEQLRLLPAAANAAGRTGAHSPSFKTSVSQKLPQCNSYDGSPLRSVLSASVDAVPAVEQGGSTGISGSFLGANVNFHGSNINFHSPCCNGTRSGTSAYGYLGQNLQVSSPVSTPIRYTHSPPSLSPPSSPSRSSPLCSGTPFDWSNGFLANGRSSFAASPNSHSPQASGSGICSPTQAGPSQLQASIGLAAHSLHGQAGIPAHRRHLDRLNSMPTISIPSSDPRSSSFSSPPSPAGMHDPRQIYDLIASLKQLEMTGSEPVWLQSQAGQVANMVGARYLLGPSPLRGNSQSVPSTPTKLWRNGERHPWRFDEREREPPMERVESGRDLRAKIFESLVKRNQQEMIDGPDVGWVNELVKEDSDHKWREM